MHSLAGDYRKIIQFAITLAAALLVLSAIRLPAQADAASHMVIVPASDGYGFDDCLGDNKACGKIVADAWCQAHGLSAALSYGRSDDVTGSVLDTKTPKIAPGSFIVNCAE
ncbi:MAG: hypothetical protein P4L76_10240 [Beijerinckiaceae bacterium]|nr:hypothetical protein [Beijerinckiaceae bacterium]